MDILNDDLLNLDIGSLPDSESEPDIPSRLFHSSDEDNSFDPDDDPDPPDPNMSNQGTTTTPSVTRYCERLPLAVLEDDDGDELEDRPRQHPAIDITEMVPGDVADHVDPSDSGFVDQHVPTEIESGLLAGRSYASWAAFDLALDEYEAKAGWRFKRLKRNTERLVARCRGGDPSNPDACQAKFTARFMKSSGRVSVRSAHLVHTCPQAIHKFRHGSHKTRWVESKLESTLRVNIETSNKDLRGMLRESESADTTVWTGNRARAKMVKKIGGDQATSFQKIPSYVDKVRLLDPGTHIEHETYRGDGRFRRIYCSPASSQRAFNYVRPFVGLDATHSGGEFPMIVLLATTFDCNNNILLLAWAVVGNETKVNWIWFCTHLALSLPRMRTCKETVVVSDRDKGLDTAVEVVWGQIYHSFCTRHLRANIITNSDKTIGDFFFDQLCRQVREVDFVKLLDGYRPINQKQQDGLDYIRKIDPKLYAHWAFPTARWGHTTSNVVEILNGVIRPIRKKPSLGICKGLWDYTMTKHFERLQTALTWPKGDNALTQHARLMINTLYQKAGGVEERPSSETSSLMCDSKGEWAVDMTLGVCECKEWQEMGFPCVHAVKFCVNRGKDEKVYIHDIWKAKNQVEAYQLPLAPISLEGLTQSNECLEPMIVPSKAKQSKSNKRKASRFEKVLANERLAAKQHQRCSICRKEGHNRLGCPIPVQRAEVRMYNDADYLRVCAIHTMSRADVGQRWLLWDSRPAPKISFSQWHEEMFPLSQDVVQASAPSG